jgi:hypothetical protein
MPRSGSGRIWAWIALAAATGVLVTLVALLVRDLAALALALVALGLAGAASWVAATRQGITRLVAVAVVALALVGGSVALVWLGAVDELIAFAVALAAFGAASHRALRQAHKAREAATAGPVAETPRPRRAVLLINPKSGGGKAKSASTSQRRRDGAVSSRWCSSPVTTCSSWQCAPRRAVRM